MTFKTHLDETAFRREISRWAKPGRTPYYPTGIICREDELIGGINGNRFWLKKIRPQLVIGSQRVFYGKITSADDGVIVKGRFQYDLMTRLTTWAFFLIILGIYIALEYSQPVDTSNFFKGLIIILLFSVIMSSLVTLGNFLFYIKEEKFVIKYLKSL